AGRPHAPPRPSPGSRVPDTCPASSLSPGIPRSRGSSPSAPSRRPAPEPFARHLLHQPHELEREQRLERLRRGHPRPTDHLIDVRRLRTERPEHLPLERPERRFGHRGPRRRHASHQLRGDFFEYILNARDELGTLLDKAVAGAMAGKPDRTRHREDFATLLEAIARRNERPALLG